MRERRERIRLSSLILAALLASTSLSFAEPTVDPDLLKGLEYRNIGPFRGGRVTAVTGVPGARDTFYMGSTGGGVWKTEDGGVSWNNLSDKDFEVGSIGAVEVAPSDSNVVYVGTGSACPRGNVSPGRGMYRSTDAGKTWQHIGLSESGQIGRVRVHPSDSDLVYVAALGHIFGPNEERGVFRSRDGGENWEKILFISDTAGVVDLALNPENPRILFAAVWETERKGWTLTSGGEQSGLWRTTDGGDTWTELAKGLPEGLKGRIGVTVSPSQPNRVWALVEAEDGGLFRSEDGGDSFTKINSDRTFRQRAWYYTHVYADPVDTDTVYIMNVGLWRSRDGGKTFAYVRGPHGDHHDLWINPNDNEIMINGNDGGATVSTNGGKTWSTQGNQPTSEMYRVTVDHQHPYRVLGCQQDNSCVSLPSRTSSSGIARQDWFEIGGCESGHIAVDPRNPSITYAGCYGGTLGRHDRDADQTREIMAYPQLAVGQAPRDLKYRFQWNAPVRLSPHDPSILYHVSQYVHRSTNEGASWEVISSDLTRNDPEKQGYAGSPITRDNTGVEVYGAIFAFEESVQTPGLLWAGTDDGRVHLSRDAGETWNEITPSSMPEWGQVNSLEVSPHAPERAFLAVTRYKFDDFTPYIFRTDNYGESWVRIADGTNGIPAGHAVRVVREDPDRQGLLYAGTEFGMYISFNDGADWQSLQLNLPVTPITDLAVHRQDLVLATQGRSFWILDNLSTLHQMTAESTGAPQFLFEPRPAVRAGGGFSFGGGGSAGKNPSAGIEVYYLLAEESEQELTLEILAPDGTVLRSLSSLIEEPQAPSPWRKYLPDADRDRKLPAKAGLNKYVWNFRLPDASLVDDAVLWGLARGPKVAPGEYQVRLSRGDWSQTRGIEVLKDPRLDTSEEDFRQQYELARAIWESLTESHEAVGRIREIRSQASALSERLAKAGREERIDEIVEQLTGKLTSIEEQIYQTRSESGQDVLNFPPKLDNQLLDLQGIVESADAAPTRGAVERYAELQKELERTLAELDSVLGSDLTELNRILEDVPAIVVPGA